MYHCFVTSDHFVYRDGVTGCGVLCAVYNAIQQLQQDEEVDMFTIVRQLLVRNPELITSLVGGVLFRIGVNTLKFVKLVLNSCLLEY